MGADLDLEGEVEVELALEQLEDDWDDRITWLVGTNKEHGPYVELGTAPHTITPDTQDFLRFEVDGRVIFAKLVEHPGTRAQPFLRPALHSAERNAQRITEGADSVEDLMRRLAHYVERHAKENVAVDTGELRSSIRAVRTE